MITADNNLAQLFVHRVLPRTHDHRTQLYETVESVMGSVRRAEGHTRRRGRLGWGAWRGGSAAMEYRPGEEQQVRVPWGRTGVGSGVAPGEVALGGVAKGGAADIRRRRWRGSDERRSGTKSPFYCEPPPAPSCHDQGRGPGCGNCAATQHPAQQPNPPAQWEVKHCMGGLT